MHYGIIKYSKSINFLNVCTLTVKFACFFILFLYICMQKSNENNDETEATIPTH